MKRSRQQPSSQALIASSPDIRPGPPPQLGGERTARSRSAIFAAGSGSRPTALCSAYIPPPAFERADSVLHVHRLEPELVDEARAAIDASTYPAESSYLPVPLAGLNELLENLPLVCRLASRRRGRA